jgi:hypothetical protein
LKATWNQHRKTRLTTAFILALIFGGRVKPEMENPNVPGDTSEFDDASLELIVNQGRWQLDRQQESFRHTTDRAQILLTVNIIVLGFIAASFHHIVQIAGIREITATVIWAVGALFVVVGIAATASVITVAADFDTVDTTKVSNFPHPVLRKVADSYAKTVRLGEITVAARVTVFRQAVRFVCWGTLIAALAYVVAA